MALRSRLNLSDEDKLEVLQRLDQFRLWHSLDEKRYCLVCGKIITGQEVRITGGENGPLRLSCPTEDCNAIPMKWVRPTDEVLIKIANQPFKTLVVLVDGSNRRSVLNGTGYVVNKAGQAVHTPIKPGSHVRVYYMNTGDSRVVDHVVVE